VTVPADPALDDAHGTSIHFHTCPLCEATCGLEVKVESGTVVRVRGDRADVFSAGFLCPKGASIRQLHHDPDRLRVPMIRHGSTWETVDWDEAFAFVADRLQTIIELYGREAVALYFGNPSSHSMALTSYTAALVGAVGTRNVYTSGTVDSISKQLAAGLMFGSSYSIAVPDIDRTSHFLILGANPVESNGSMWVVPDVPGRLAALRARGGRLVVVDPRLTKTAAIADEHVPIRPGTDVYLLLAMAHTLFDEQLVDTGSLTEHLVGVDDVERAVAGFPAERVEAICGIPAATIRRLARDLAAADRAVIYGRMGTSVQEFGTVASWLIDTLNVLTGNLDRPGGAMFPRPVAGSPNMWGAAGAGRGVAISSERSRVRGLRRIFGETPVATLADEILTPGDGQIRALISVAGNPVSSTPDTARLAEAVRQLELVVSVDFYLNETSRLAHVILPPVSPLEREHFDSLLYRMAIRHVANYSPPVVTAPAGSMDEWQILSRLALIAQGRPGGEVAALDDSIAADLAARASKGTAMMEAGVTAERMLRAVEPRTGPSRLIDILVRSGPYGDAFGARPEGLSLDVLIDHPHGVDAGPMESRVPEVLRTPSGMIELAPQPLLDDLARVEAAFDRDRTGGLLLIGRRDLRSNNSWMHNVPTLVTGPDRCTLQIHPDDAAVRGLGPNSTAIVASRVGEIEVAVEIVAGLMPGVVSLPHGWGHAVDEDGLSVASRHPGVNSNVLTDGQAIDEVSGNAVLNGIPVTVRAMS
jgi:anaerobic selenocysteine-containing dehydrogenase